MEKYGLIVLNKTRRPGLRKLIEAAGIEPGRVDTVAVGFYIGPRINAASRMDHADAALRTVLATSEEEAGPLAARLDRLNSDRQRYTQTIMLEADRLVAADPDRKAYVLAGEGWAAGVVGLVAGKLADQLGRPVFVFGQEGDRYVGSGRGIADFDIMAALEDSKDSLARYGGHHSACGLTIEGKTNFEKFTASLTAYADKVLAGRDLRPTLDIDAEIRASQATWELVGWLEKFEPFGEGNERPKFLLRGLRVSNADAVGRDGRHLRVNARGDQPRDLKLIGFGMAAEAIPVMVPGSRLDAVVEIGVNEWNGNKSIQLRLVDWCLADAGAAALCASAPGIDIPLEKITTILPL